MNRTPTAHLFYIMKISTNFSINSAPRPPIRDMPEQKLEAIKLLIIATEPVNRRSQLLSKMFKGRSQIEAVRVLPI